jgi:hypothetical protein
MITVLRAHGLSLAIYLHDHEPPHVHVLGEGRAKVLLIGRGGDPDVIDIRA